MKNEKLLGNWSTHMTICKISDIYLNKICVDSAALSTSSKGLNTSDLLCDKGEPCLNILINYNYSLKL